MVLADFDQMGSLIENKLIPKDPFLQAYWNTIISSYEVLEVSKEKRDFYNHFKDLYSKSKSFQKGDIVLEKDIYSEYYENSLEYHN